MNDTAPTLQQIAARAMSNAEALVRYQKDGAGANKDAKHDLRTLMHAGSRSRFGRAVYLLTSATVMASEGDLTPAVQLALVGLGQLVAEEAGMAAAQTALQRSIDPPAFADAVPK